MKLDAYDAGLLGSYGNGDVDWWHDYIRAELGRAHDYYEAQAAPVIAEKNELIVKLWALLDDIDTLDDAAKDNDAAFRKRCYEIQQKRHGLMTGDQWEALGAKP